MTQTPPGPGGPRRTPRIAVNPIPYWSRDGKVDKSKEVFDEAFADFADIGFTAVKADGLRECPSPSTPPGSAATVLLRRSACSAHRSTRRSTCG